MLLSPRSRLRLGPLAVAAGLATAAAALAAEPKPPSLAEYIGAIGSAALRPASPREAPFLSETVAMHPYVLALADHPDGSGANEPLQAFMTNPAGSAIVNAIGPIRQVVHRKATTSRRYLVIVAGSGAKPGKPVQVQAE